MKCEKSMIGISIRSWMVNILFKFTTKDGNLKKNVRTNRGKMSKGFFLPHFDVKVLLK